MIKSSVEDTKHLLRVCRHIISFYSLHLLIVSTFFPVLFPLSSSAFARSNFSHQMRGVECRNSVSPKYNGQFVSLLFLLSCSEDGDWIELDIVRGACVSNTWSRSYADRRRGSSGDSSFGGQRVHYSFWRQPEPNWRKNGRKWLLQKRAGHNKCIRFKYFCWLLQAMKNALDFLPQSEAGKWIAVTHPIFKWEMCSKFRSIASRGALLTSL